MQIKPAPLVMPTLLKPILLPLSSARKSHHHGGGGSPRAEKSDAADDLRRQAHRIAADVGGDLSVILRRLDRDNRQDAAGYGNNHAGFKANRLTF